MEKESKVVLKLQELKSNHFRDEIEKNNEETIMNRKLKKSEEKVQKCNLCSKTFALPNQLHAHMKNVHENIKKYQCDLCEKTFIYKTYLKTHTKSVHEKTLVYNCTYLAKSSGLSKLSLLQ